MFIFISIIIGVIWLIKSGSETNNVSNNMEYGLNRGDLSKTPFIYNGYVGEFLNENYCYKGKGFHHIMANNIDSLNTDGEIKILFHNIGYHSFSNEKNGWSFGYNIIFDSAQQRFSIGNGMINDSKTEPLDSKFYPTSNVQDIDLYANWIYTIGYFENTKARHLINKYFSSLIVINNLIRMGYLRVEVDNHQVVTYEFINESKVKLTRYLIDLYEVLWGNYDRKWNYYEKLLEEEKAAEQSTVDFSSINNLDPAILHRISKLLLTAEQGVNQNESLVAFQKAQALMKKKILLI